MELNGIHWINGSMAKGNIYVAKAMLKQGNHNNNEWIMNNKMTTLKITDKLKHENRKSP